MNKFSLWLVATIIAFITFWITFTVSTTRNSSLAHEASSIFAFRTQTYLNQITNSMRNDIIMERLRLVRGQLSALRAEALFSEFSIRKRDQVIEESDRYSSLRDSKDYLVSEIPIFYSQGGERWGKIIYLTSYKDLNKVLKDLETNVIINSFVASLTSLVGLALFFGFVWRTGAGISKFFENLLILNREESPGPLTSLLWSPMLGGIKFTAFEFRRVQKELENARVKGLLGEMATQVAHDIRSPLAALEMMMKDTTALPEEQRLLVRSATTRIRDIANDLLSKKNVSATATDADPASPQLLSALLELIVTEKRMQYRDRTSVEIEAQFEEETFGSFVDLPANDFKRVISNLVNNSVEAMSTGHVIVALRAEKDEVLVEVQDNGNGIPPELLVELGNRNVSRGKKGTESGSGLGVSHARQSAESWNGRLEISSEVGKGSIFTLRLPKAAPPNWFLSEITLADGEIPVVIDDDISVLRIWEGRFGSIEIKDFLYFSSAENFKNWHVRYGSHGRYKFLFDYELLGSSETGLDLIEGLQLAGQSILVTSHFEEKKIQSRAEHLRVKLLPKGLAAFVPIRRAPSLDAILVDNDLLVHQLWEISARKRNKTILCFSSSAQMFARLSEISNETRIYIDSNLAVGELRGEEIAKNLFARGYKNIFLCTGHQASHFPPMPWIKEIVGKEPPFF